MNHTSQFSLGKEMSKHTRNPSNCQLQKRFSSHLSISFSNQGVLDIAQQMFSKDNVTVKCDPLNPGDDYHGILKARFLASWASWRGNYQTKEVDKVTAGW